jgi:hypothetical protein
LLYKINGLPAMKFNRRFLKDVFGWHYNQSSSSDLIPCQRWPPNDYSCKVCKKLAHLMSRWCLLRTDYGHQMNCDHKRSPWHFVTGELNNNDQIWQKQVTKTSVDCPTYPLVIISTIITFNQYLCSLTPIRKRWKKNCLERQKRLKQKCCRFNWPCSWSSW